MSLSDYGDGVKVLTRGGEVVAFATYSQARCAIKHTVDYAERENLPWHSSADRIVPLRSYLKPKRRRR